MAVYGCLCVSRSIESASIPRQPCDTAVTLLIVTPARSRASGRHRQSEGEGGMGGETVTGTEREWEEGEFVEHK